MMASKPGLPNSPESLFRVTAAACVGLADLVTGWSQFDAADAVAEAEAGAAVLAAGSEEAVSAADTMGSGTMVGSGNGAGAAVRGGTVGAGAGAAGGGVGVFDGGGPPGLPLPGSSGCELSVGQRRRHSPGLVSVLSARAGTAADRPTVSASAAMAEAAAR